MIDCSIEHLINIVLEGMSGTLMRISQHQHFHFIPRGALRVCAVPDKCFPVLSAEVGKENSDGEVGEVQHIYSK